MFFFSFHTSQKNHVGSCGEPAVLCACRICIRLSGRRHCVRHDQPHGLSIGFEGAPNCNFTAAGSGLFALNQTWYECFPTPINAAGTTTNAIDVASIWHTDLGALPTLYTLLTLQFQTLVEVTSSLVINTDTATVTVYEPAAVHPTPPPVTAAGSSGGGAAIGAGVGAIVGGLFLLLGTAACWRTTRRQQTVAPAV